MKLNKQLLHEMILKEMMDNDSPEMIAKDVINTHGLDKLNSMMNADVR